ncbi:MAG: FHA domain-containing protein, partial [Gemmataceae bacterium]
MIAKPPQRTTLPLQPTLVLLYGNSNATKQQWPIIRDSLIIGKSRGCDLILEAGDISNLHCVITRNAGGFSIRDCNSRAGIKLNGDKIQEASLYDGAIIHVGPFCFRIDIPAVRNNLETEPRHLRLDRKRRNLARLALGLRKRICQQETRSNGRAPSEEEKRILDARRNALDARQEELDQLIHEANERADDLDAAEAEMKLERVAFERDVAEFRDLVAQKEAQLAEREIDLSETQTTHKAEFDKGLAERKKNFEQELQERREVFDEELARIHQEFDKECQQRRDALNQELKAKREQAEEEIARRLTQVGFGDGLPDQNRPENNDGFGDGLPDQNRPENNEDELEKTLAFLPSAADFDLPDLTSETPQDLTENINKLRTRQQELESFGRHLRKMRDELQQERNRQEIAHQNLTRGVLEMQMEQKEHMLTREQWAQEHAEATQRLLRQREAIAEAEAELREQREHIKQMTTELKEAQEQVRKQGSEELAALRKENDELRGLIGELQEHMTTFSGPENDELQKDLEKAQKAISLLRKAMEEKDQESARLQQQSKAD